MKLCFDIIRTHHQEVADPHHVEDLRERKETLLTTLMLTEIVEFLTPLAYVIAVCVAYYGPNANIIGDIRNDYWQYQSIEYLPTFLSRLFCSIVIDLLCGVITLVVFWCSCRINGLRCYKEQFVKLSFVLAFCITREINLVSNYNRHFDLYITIIHFN